MSKKTIYRVLAGILLFLVILLAFLPLILKKVAVNNSKEWIGRSISLEKFKVNYFTGTVKLINFKLFELDDHTVFVDFDTLIIDTEPYRFISNELVIEQLYLKGLDVNVMLKDSTFNFDDLITRFSSESADLTKETSEDPLILELSNLELNDGFFTLHDEVIDKKMELSNLDFFIPFIRLDRSEKSEAGLKFDFKNGGFLQSKIDVDPIGGDFEADLTIKDLDISGYDDFIAKYINLGPFTGQTDIDLKLEGNIKKPENTVITGNVQLNKFELKDEGNAFVGLKQLNIAIKEMDHAQNRFVIDTVQLIGPYLYFEMYDSTNNVTEFINRLLVKENTDQIKTDNTAADTLANPIYYAVNTVLVEEGMVDILDSRTGEPFKYHLSNIKLATDSISSEADWVEAESAMLLNERGKLVASVGVNPSNPMNLSVEYTISDFMLGDLNIYSRHYMGFPILYGDMYYKASTSIVDGNISSENKLIIHNVELGNKKGGLYDLPLNFALFLLKDKDGVITLDVPVRGDLKNPKVSVKKIVWNTFKNLILKTAAAPGKLLAGLIGANPNDISSIEYNYLDTAFTEKRQHQIDLLLQLEQEKPDLEIELIYLNDPELERNEIALAEAGKIFQKKKNKNYQQDEAAFEEFVRDEVKSDSIDVLSACLQLVDKTTIDSLSNQYNRERISDIEQYLKLTNDSTEIVVIREKTNAPKNIGSKPMFDVKYGMKEETLQ